jgi:hypothetical protein
MAKEVVAADGTVDLWYPLLTVITLHVSGYFWSQLNFDNTFRYQIYCLSCLLPSWIIIGSKLALG